MVAKTKLRVPAESQAFATVPEMRIPKSAAPVEILRGTSQSPLVGRASLGAPPNARWHKHGAHDTAHAQATGNANASARAAVAKCSKAQPVAPVMGRVQIRKPAPVESETDE